MAESHQSISLESPREVRLDQLERELTQLWKAAETVQGDSIPPVTRACTMNLIVVTENAAGADEVAEMIGDVTLEHPARVFLVILDRKAPEPSLDAWISARCSLPVPGERQVCCEQITLRARGRDAGKIPSVVTSLLVSDISTMLLWKTAIDTGDPLLQSLLEISDRALIDSSEELSPLPALVAWNALVDSGTRHATLGDLAWTHATAWRAVIANAFQPQEMRPFLDALDSIAIEYSSSTTPRHTGFSQALLLMGWLAGALRWKASGGKHQANEQSLTCSFTTARRTITVTLKQVSMPGRGRGGIERIALAAGTGKRLELSSKTGGNEIAVDRHTDNGAPEQQLVVPIRNLTESELMARELEILEQDTVYEKSLDLIAAAIQGEAHREPAH